MSFPCNKTLPKDLTYTYDMLFLRPIGMASVNSIIFALFKVHPIYPDVVLVSIIDIVVQVKNIVT